MRRTARPGAAAYLGLALWCLVIAAFGGGGLYAVGSGVQRAWDHHQAMSSSGITGVLAPLDCSRRGTYFYAPLANGDPGQASTRCAGVFEAPGVGQHPVRIADERPDDDWSSMPQMRISSPDSALAWSHPFSWFTTVVGLGFKIALVMVAGLLIPRVVRRFRLVLDRSGSRAAGPLPV